MFSLFRFLKIHQMDGWVNEIKVIIDGNLNIIGGGYTCTPNQ